MHISGRFYPTNWSGGPNAWILSYSGTQLPEGVGGSETCDASPHDYSLSWDYRLNKDTGNIVSNGAGTATVIKNNAFKTAGETYTNCSPCADTTAFPDNLDPVKGPYPDITGSDKNQATWTVATTDILSGIPPDSATSKVECSCTAFSNGAYTC